MRQLESGKRDDHPKLAQAIAHAQREELRLSSQSSTGWHGPSHSSLRYEKTARSSSPADMPEANTLSIGLLAALAQHERELISERTKAALKAKKARGCILGSPQNLTREATLQAAEARRRRALEDPAKRRTTELAVLYGIAGLPIKRLPGS